MRRAARSSRASRETRAGRGRSAVLITSRSPAAPARTGSAASAASRWAAWPGTRPPGTRGNSWRPTPAAALRTSAEGSPAHGARSEVSARRRSSRALAWRAGSCGFPHASHGSLVGRRHAGKQRSECGAVVVPVVLVELADRLDQGVDQQHALVLGDLRRDSSFGESGDGPDREVVAGEGVRRRRRCHVSRCLARVWPGGLMPRTRSPRRPGDDDQALDMARSGRQLRRPVPGAALSLYPQLKTSNILLE